VASPSRDPSHVTQSVPRDGRWVSQGYRQGIITAIAVMLGFTLAFVRFWGFEAPGVWTYRSVIAPSDWC
jgi:hypothetical protein